MRIRSIVITVLGAAAAAGLVLGPPATAKPARQASGTVEIGADRSRRRSTSTRPRGTRTRRASPSTRSLPRARTTTRTYGCGGDQNYMNYCNRKVSTMLQKAQFTPDAKVRSDMLNRAEVLMAEDVPSIPMFVRPGFLINNRKVSGTVINPTNQGSTWNVQSWTVRAA